MFWNPMSIAMKLVTTRTSIVVLSHDPTSLSAMANTKPAGSAGGGGRPGAVSSGLSGAPGGGGWGGGGARPGVFPGGVAGPRGGGWENPADERDRSVDRTGDCPARVLGFFGEHHRRLEPGEAGEGEQERDAQAGADEVGGVEG